MVFNHYHQYADDTQLHLAMTTQLQDCRRVYRRRQTAVPTEQPVAKPGQVGGSSRRHCESTVCHRLICIISIRR